MNLCKFLTTCSTELGRKLKAEILRLSDQIGYSTLIHYEVCEGAPVAVGGWVLTDRHDLASCAARLRLIEGSSTHHPQPPAMLHLPGDPVPRWGGLGKFY